jgi:CDP-glucose 4,6-dehydratase
LVEVRPEIVFHLAAQPLVLASYDDPLSTWATNVMGSAHLMQALRMLDAPCSAVMVTTDKVYENREWRHPYRETDRLGGHDPYSASKAAMEIAVASWRRSFCGAGGLRLATARAGNVIGGGDWAADRIVPDIVRALSAGQPVGVRNPGAVRPFQHVLEPLSGYLRLAAALHQGRASDSYNFGPEPSDIMDVRGLVEAALTHWPGRWEDRSDPQARHEAGLLSLGIESARADLEYAPRWNADRAIAETIRWYRAIMDGAGAADLTQDQIASFGAP